MDVQGGAGEPRLRASGRFPRGGGHCSRALELTTRPAGSAGAPPGLALLDAVARASCAGSRMSPIMLSSL